MKMRRLLITLLLAVGVASLNAQSSIAGVGFYGTTPTAMLNGGAGYGATAYAPASFTLTGYNATGLTPGSTTYTSGITATGTVTQTCTLTFSSSGSPITAAVCFGYMDCATGRLLRCSAGHGDHQRQHRQIRHSIGSRM